MRVPCLLNETHCLEQYRNDQEMTPRVDYIGNGDKLEDNLIEKIVNKISEIFQDCSIDVGNKKIIQARGNQQKFDDLCAQTLHQDLPIGFQEANLDQFWSFLAIVKTPNIVWGRFNNEQNVADMRFIAGRKKWKHMFSRLWWRAELAYNSDDEDPYKLMRTQGEQFWVTVLEREISSSRNLVLKLLDYFSDKNFKTEEYETILQRLRKLWSSYLIENMDEEELEQLIEYSINTALGVEIQVE